MQVRDVILYFSLKYKGDWQSIYEAIKNLEAIDEEKFEQLKEKNNASYITILDEDYPSFLKNIYRPPYVIYYYGEIKYLSYRNILAIVGSREPNEYGIKVTEAILPNIKGEEVVFVSGLAKGIDSLAHNCALENNIPTIAVLGTGIDYCYPKSNFELYEKIKDNGLIISEYPYKVIVGKESFSQRNRIITGISNFVFAPEVKDKSGTLVSIRFALSQGKDIFTIPCSIFEDTVSNRLIQDGAKIILSAQDIIEEFK